MNLDRYLLADLTRQICGVLILSGFHSGGGLLANSGGGQPFFLDGI